MWFDDFSVSGGVISQLKTYVPDDNFENYLEANGMGDGIASNDSVLTSSINSVTFLSLNFWIIQFGRAFALFTPISFIISIYYWWNKPELKKNRIIFIQLISVIFLLLTLSQWFSIHNFALYYFWLPISFGTAYLLNRFSNRARWIIQSITI